MTGHQPLAPGNNSTIEIRLSRDAKDPMIHKGNLSEQEILEWVKSSGEFELSDNDDPDLAAGGLRLLYGCGHKSYGTDDLNLPFNVDTLEQILARFRLPQSFSHFLDEDTNRFSKETLYTESGEVCGFNFVLKLYSWWLGTYTLALSYNAQAKVIRGLLVGLKHKLLQDLKGRLERSAQYAGNPMLVPILLCEMLVERLAKELHTSRKRILALEVSLGVNDYGESSEILLLASTDFTSISQTLNGELSRMANYENWASSHIVLLQNILNSPSFQTVAAFEKCSAIEERAMSVLREKGECLHWWNIDLLARIQCQQKIINGQIQTVYNLLAQRDNKLNFTIAAASQRDSTAMKTIAIVTMIFLPGAYIATLFSMTMFDWQAKGDGKVVSEYFWIYWALAIPITILVLLAWILWTRPWKASAQRQLV